VSIDVLELRRKSDLIMAQFVPWLTPSWIFSASLFRAKRHAKQHKTFSLVFCLCVFERALKMWGDKDASTKKKEQQEAHGPLSPKEEDRTSRMGPDSGGVDQESGFWPYPRRPGQTHPQSGSDAARFPAS